MQFTFGYVRGIVTGLTNNRYGTPFQKGDINETLQGAHADATSKVEIVFGFDSFQS